MDHKPFKSQNPAILVSSHFVSPKRHQSTAWIAQSWWGHTCGMLHVEDDSLGWRYSEKGNNERCFREILLTFTAYLGIEMIDQDQDATTKPWLSWYQTMAGLVRMSSECCFGRGSAPARSFDWRCWSTQHLDLIFTSLSKSIHHSSVCFMYVKIGHVGRLSNCIWP